MPAPTLSQTYSLADGTTVTVGVNVDVNDATKSAVGTNDVVFYYDGIERVVRNPQLVAGSYIGGRYNPLIEGLEVSRDGFATNQFKRYQLNKIVVYPV